jgi:hypothetical protein
LGEETGPLYAHGRELLADSRKGMWTWMKQISLAKDFSKKGWYLQALCWKDSKQLENESFSPKEGYKQHIAVFTILLTFHWWSIWMWCLEC